MIKALSLYSNRTVLEGYPNVSTQLDTVHVSAQLDTCILTCKTKCFRFITKFVPSAKFQKEVRNHLQSILRGHDNHLCHKSLIGRIRQSIRIQIIYLNYIYTVIYITPFWFLF